MLFLNIFASCNFKNRCNLLNFTQNRSVFLNCLFVLQTISLKAVILHAKQKQKWHFSVFKYPTKHFN